MSEFPGDETFEQETGYPEDDPLGLEGGPAFEGNGSEPDPDPFAEVPPAPAEPDDLPPGVEPGSLGGVNPSDMEPINAEDEPPYEPGAPVEPGPGDVADDDLPPSPEDVGLGDEPPAPPETEPEPEPAADPLAEGTDQEDLTAPVRGGQDNTQLESEQTQAPETDPENDPDPNAEPPKPAAKPRKKRRSKGPKLSPGQREYTILRAVTADGFDKPLWEEALSSPIVARSGELALRKAFRTLSENKPGAFELVPVPTKYWNPESVEGEVPDAALAIKVGGKKK